MLEFLINLYFYFWEFVLMKSLIKIYFKCISSDSL